MIPRVPLDYSECNNCQHAWICPDHVKKKKASQKEEKYKNGYYKIEKEKESGCEYVKRVMK